VTHLRKAMLEELQRRNLSQITIRSYLRAVQCSRGIAPQILHAPTLPLPSHDGNPDMPPASKHAALPPVLPLNLATPTAIDSKRIAPSCQTEEASVLADLGSSVAASRLPCSFPAATSARSARFAAWVCRWKRQLLRFRRLDVHELTLIH
jgi:hypothetical protein